MATIKDVAEKAQVAKSTVSYAFNKPHLVNAHTLQRILQAARDLNYHPNVFAQGLAGGKTQMIGLLVPDIGYPFNATIARGTEDKLRQEGYISITSSTDGESEQIIKLMGQLRRRGVSGFIITPSFHGIGSEVIQAILALQAGKVPVVVAGFPVDHDEIDQVDYRPQSSSRELINHLIEHGHRDIAYIGATHSFSGSPYRFFGYQESLFQHHIPLRPELVIETNVTPDQVKEAMDRLMSLEQPPTAIFALNDVVTYAVLDYCHQNQISIPEDLSIVTFDYQAFAQRVTPGITSIVVPVYDVGRASAELLLNRIKNFDAPIQHVKLPYSLVVRDTTSRPRKS